MAYESRHRSQALDRLFQAILSLESVDECYRFFEDLCTVGEMRAMAARFQTAELLVRGATYDDIQRQTGMSSATISRIRRWLFYGADGYRLALGRLGVAVDGTAPSDPPS